MNYTKNYHLPQWEENDRVLRLDFNNAMAALEDGLQANASATDQVKRIAEAAYSSGNKPYVIGRYPGTGGSQTITLGFRPSFLIISGTKSTPDANGATRLAYFFGATSGENLNKSVQFTDSGFIVTPGAASRIYPDLVNGTMTYEYIAFR
ncbi:MAG: hypothetical protein K2O93_06965 [Oscillospiraceae bacterium]|nr:hypothetical protein [Oscillospiraceae bacterium]